MGGVAAVVASPDAIDFTEPDATLVTESPTGTAKVAMNRYALLAGRSGGQTLVGGTGTGDSLDLRASAAANYTGSVRVGAGVGDVGDGVAIGMLLFPDGLTLGQGVAVGIGQLSTITQTENVNNEQLGSMVADFRTVKGADASVNSYRPVVSIVSEPTVANDTAAGVAGFIQVGLFNAPACTNTGAGSIAGSIYGMLSQPRAVDTGCTLDDVYGVAALDAGSVSGTVSHAYGFYAGRLTAATANFPYAAYAHAITGTVKTSEGVWGTEAHAPSRFYYKNDAQQVWRMGYATMKGTGLALGTGTASIYFAPDSRMNATTPIDAARSIAPGPITVFAMSCGISVLPGSGVTRTFTLTSIPGPTQTAVTCDIVDPASACTYHSAAGVAISPFNPFAIESTASGGSPEDADAGCTVFYTVDAF